MELSDSSATDGVHTYFAWIRPVESGGAWWWYYVVSREDGESQFVLRRPPDPLRPEELCASTQLAITHRSFAIAVLLLGGSLPTQSIPIRGRFDEPVRTWASETSRPSTADAIQEIWTSDTVTALDSAGRTYRYGPDRMIETLDLPAGPSWVEAVVDDEISRRARASTAGRACVSCSGPRPRR